MSSSSPSMIDFTRAKNAMKELANINKNTKTTMTADEYQKRLLFLQHEILRSNPVGRSLLQDQLRNVFDQDGNFIFDPRSLENNLIPPQQQQQQQQQNVVILLSGALNPIHKAHIKAALLGASEVEKQFGTHQTNTITNKKRTTTTTNHHDDDDDRPPSLIPGHVKVIGCALVPSSDGYVMSKLGKGAALTCEMRCKFTDAACIQETREFIDKAVKYCIDVVIGKTEKELGSSTQTSSSEVKKNDDHVDHEAEKYSNKNDVAAIVERVIQNEPFVDQDHFFPLFCLPYNQASAGWCCRLLEKELKDEYIKKNEVESGNDKKKKSPTPPQFMALRLYGSDFCMKHRNYRDMVCIQRNDEEKSGEYVAKIVKQGTQVGENFIFVHQDPDRDVFAGTAHCSSTAIRKALQRTSNNNNCSSSSPSSTTSPLQSHNHDPRVVLSPMLHTPVMEKMIELTELKMEAERKAAEEKRKKEEMIAFYKEKKNSEKGEGEEKGI